MSCQKKEFPYPKVDFAIDENINIEKMEDINISEEIMHEEKEDINIFEEISHEENNEFHFGNYQWGMANSTIQMNKGIPDDESFWGYGLCNSLYYNNRIVEGHNVNITYTLFRDGLDHVSYRFIGNYTIDRWIEIYIDLRRNLKKIYGDKYITTDEKTIEWIKQEYEERETNISHPEFLRFAHDLWYHFESEIGLSFVYNKISHSIEIYVSELSPNYWENLHEYSPP
jgi:hypothetical protein